MRKIKGYVDELAGVGVPVHHEQYVDALLEGLSSDYALSSLLSRVRSVFPPLLKLKLFSVVMKFALHATIEMLRQSILCH